MKSSNGWKQLLSPKRIIKPSLVVGTISYLSLLIISLSIAVTYGYSMTTNSISDLGSINETPIPYLHDIVCVLGGIICLPVNFFLKSRISHLIPVFQTSKKLNIYSLLSKSAYSSGIIGNIGYFFLGIFSLDRAGPNRIYHNSCALISFSGFIFSIFLFSFCILTLKIYIPKSIGIYGLIVPGMICAFAFLNPIPLLEWMLLLSILGFVIPINLGVLKVKI